MSELCYELGDTTENTEGALEFSVGQTAKASPRGDVLSKT